MCELIQDEEFDALVFPVGESAYNELEEDIFDNGCREPVIVWNNLIVDGRKRYEICQRWEMPFYVTSITFDSRYEAVCWICKNQLQRSDLPDIMRKYLIGTYYVSRRSACLYDPDGSDNSPAELKEQYRIAREIAEEIHMSEGAVYKYGTLSKALKNIAVKNRSVFDKIVSGKLRIAQLTIIELARLPKEELQALDNILPESSKARINLADIRHELQWHHSMVSAAPAAQKKGDKPRMLIKDIPAYDPDAEISSLAFTIPSWVSSMERTCSVADFPNTTAAARERLLRELAVMYKAVVSIQKRLEEVKTDG